MDVTAMRCADTRHMFVFAAALLFMAYVAFAASLPTILVEKVDPQPVEPGKDLTIDITLFNRLTSEIGDFSVALDAGFPFIFKSSTDDLTRVNLCGGCKKQNKYFLSIDPAAVSGNYPVYVRAFSGGVDVRQKIDVKIQGKPNIVFSAGGEGLKNVTPNSQFPVLLNVTNIGSGQASQIKIQPDSTSFVSMGSSIKTLNTLNASETRQALFEFVAASSLEANSYLIPFRISYLDEQGNAINASQNLGLRVVNKGDINIQTVKIASSAGGSVVTAGQPFTAVVRLENVGKGNADFIVAEIDCPFGTKKAFLGQLKKDEDAPAVFDLMSANPGTFTCGLNVAYADDIGSHQFSDRFDVTVNRAGFSGAMLFALVGIAALAFVFRKRITALFGRKK